MQGSEYRRTTDQDSSQEYMERPRRLKRARFLRKLQKGHCINWDAGRKGESGSILNGRQEMLCFRADPAFLTVFMLSAYASGISSCTLKVPGNRS
jgi:hypothetical protein